MSTLGSYLLQMTCWLGSFWLVYFILLRKETFFKLNRWFLLSGLIASLLMPFFSIRYKVESTFTNIPTMPLAYKPTSIESTVSVNYWLIVYFIGVIVFLLWYVYQNVKLHQLRLKSEQITMESTCIFKIEKDTAPFSFFNSIFVSKNMCSQTLLNTVIAHEKVHIDERHWVDLLLLEVARALQWFNPLLILYRKAIMQNHEFLADSGTLQKGVSAHIYKAMLANQMLGIPVFKVVNGFTFFKPTKRIYMMNKDKSKPIKGFKLLLILPLISIILAGFAKPLYVTSTNAISTLSSDENLITVKGKIIDQVSEKPLEGTSIVIANSTLGTSSDANGNYVLEGVKPDDKLVFSFVGYETVSVKAGNIVDIKMIKTVTPVQTERVEEAPPPPLAIKNIFDGKKPLLIVDGKIDAELDISKIDQETISVINVLKDKSATDKYGSAAKDGAIEITTKEKKNNETMNAVFYIVEEMPKYKDGVAALNAYIANAIAGSEDHGVVEVAFTVSKDGTIKNAKIVKGASHTLNKKTLEIISVMPEWNPGKQRGKPVDVELSMVFQF